MIKGFLIFALFTMLTPSIVFGGSRLAPLINPGDEVDGRHDNQLAKEAVLDAVSRLRRAVPQSKYLAQLNIRDKVSAILSTGPHHIVEDERIETEVDPSLCKRELEDGSHSILLMDYVKGSSNDASSSTVTDRIILCPRFFEKFPEQISKPFEERVTGVAYWLAYETSHLYGFESKGGAAATFADRTLCEFPGSFPGLDCRAAASLYIDMESIPAVTVNMEGSGFSLSSWAWTTETIKEKTMTSFLRLMTDVVSGQPFEALSRSFGVDELSGVPSASEEQLLAVGILNARRALTNRFVEIRHSDLKATHLLSVDGLEVNMERSDDGSGTCEISMAVTVSRIRPLLFTDRQKVSLPVKPFENCLQGQIPKGSIQNLISEVFSKIHGTSSAMGPFFRVNVNPVVPVVDVTMPATGSTRFNDGQLLDFQDYVQNRLRPAIDSWLPGHGSPVWPVTTEFSSREETPVDFYGISLTRAFVDTTDKVKVGLEFQIVDADGNPMEDEQGQAKTWVVEETSNVELMNLEVLAEETYNQLFQLYQRSTEEATIFASGRACEFQVGPEGKKFSGKTVRSFGQQGSIKNYIKQLKNNPSRLEKRVWQECRDQLEEMELKTPGTPKEKVLD